ncbi:MAG: WbqC family protein [Bacteroidales bacterium]|nr:WbqC family protein [Bacteroidales bacterium]
MILAGNQPYFLPYLGWWQLIKAADLFLISDDYNFIKDGWICRNRILVEGKPIYFRIEVRKKSNFRYIKDTQLMPLQVGKKLKTLEFAYRRAPFFSDGIALAERILRYPETNLACFLEHSIREVCSFLSITTPLKRTSEMEGNSLFKREERIYDACRRVGADTYINAIGGTKLYNRDEFASHGITLKFLKSGFPEYPQFRKPFVDRLSILDAIMFNSKEDLQKMLEDYTLIDGDGK